MIKKIYNFISGKKLQTLKLSIGLIGFAMLLALVWPKKYSSEATLLTTGSTNTLSSVFSSMEKTSLLSSLNLNKSLPAVKVLNILRSRVLAEMVVNSLPKDRFEDFFSTPYRDSEDFIVSLANTIRKKHVLIEFDEKKSIIRLRSRSKQPELSYYIVNSYVDNLRLYIETKSKTLARTNRQFIEKQLETVVTRLKTSEQALKEFQERYAFFQPDKEMENLAKVSSTIESEIISRQVELDVMRNNEQRNSAEFSKLELEKKSLERQLEAMRGKLKRATIGSDGAPSIPNLGMKFLQLKREVIAEEAVYQIYVKQYELAKIEEFQSDSMFEVLDKPLLSKGPSSPNLKIIFILSFIIFPIISYYIVHHAKIEAVRKFILEHSS